MRSDIRESSGCNVKFIKGSAHDLRDSTGWKSGKVLDVQIEQLHVAWLSNIKGILLYSFVAHRTILLCMGMHTHQQKAKSEQISRRVHGVRIKPSLILSRVCLKACGSSSSIIIC